MFGKTELLDVGDIRMVAESFFIFFGKTFFNLKQKHEDASV